MKSGGTRDKPAKEKFLSQRPRIMVMAVEEREGMPWFRELRGTDGTLYRIYHRGGEMYGFNVETGETLFDRKEGDANDGMSLDSVLLEQVADIFEFVDDVEATNCVECLEKYPVTHVPDICDQCVCPTRIWTVTKVLPIEYKKLPLPLEYWQSMHDQFGDFRGSWSEKIHDEILRDPLVGGWIIQDDKERECHVVYTDKFLVSFLSERDKNGDPIGAVVDLRALEPEESNSLGPDHLDDLKIKPIFDLSHKYCPSCYCHVGFFDTACSKCGEDL